MSRKIADAVWSIYSNASCRAALIDFEQTNPTVRDVGPFLAVELTGVAQEKQ